MKSIVKISMFFCFLLLMGSISSCKHEHGAACSHGHSHAHDHDDNIDKSGPEWTSDYVCPIHCEGSGSDKEGSCPVCLMKLVEKKDIKTSTCKHGHDHSGHDHSGHNHHH